MAASRRAVTVGWVIMILVSLLFVFSAYMKFAGGPEFDKVMEHLELAGKIPVIPLAILELTCVAIYLIPPTSVLGAILLAGYMGGTILTAWRVGDSFIVQIILGMFVWLGIYLREDRLRALIPLRTSPAS
jgi:DoxX-like family